MSNDQRSAAADRTGRGVAIIGGGTAAETLVAELDGSGLDVTVFEDDRVGGECPFVACMPTKSMLHDAATGRSWGEAVRRRSRVVEHLDDSEHATGARTTWRCPRPISGVDRRPGQGRRRWT